MRHPVPRLIGATVTAFLLSTSVSAQQPQMPPRVAQTPVPSLAPMIKTVSPAVVNIATRGTIRDQQRNPFMDDPFFRRFFEGQQPGPRERQFQSAGSGVIVDAARGFIVTNAHVVENATEITVTLHDDRSFQAEVVGRDPASDVALLKITSKGLTALKLADSSRAEVGDFVVAIGNPFGLQHTVTSGIISALGRSGINPEGYEDFIQTDASINPGNSGGALVNLQGELVGINTAIFSRGGGNIGIGFAIPSNMVQAVMSQLIEHGEVRRGVLGVELAPAFTPDIAESLGLENNRGALVQRVVDGGPADKAGIRAGDVITSVNGRTVGNSTELRNSIGMLRIGSKVEIGLIREGRARRVTATIGERGSTDAEVAAQLHRGLEGAELANAERNAGVVIRTVAEGSPAALNNLRPNDVIIGVGRTRVTNLEQLRAALPQGNNPFAITILRGNSQMVFPVR